MIKEALDYLVKLGLERQALKKIGERDYSLVDLHPVMPPTLPVVTVSTLQGLVDVAEALEDERGYMADAWIAVVRSPVIVELISESVPPWNPRPTAILARMNPENIVCFPFNTYLDVEMFILGAMTAFDQHAGDIKDVLKIVSNIKDEAIKTATDDGVSQTVTVKAGLVKAEQVKIQNPIRLRPFRTFPEVTQPESKYVLRFRREPTLQAGLWEVKDSQWEPQAMKNIADYLTERLNKSIEVVV